MRKVILIGIPIITIAIIILATMYFGIKSPAGGSITKCVFSTGFSCTDWHIIGNDKAQDSEVRIEIISALREPITLTTVSIVDEENTICQDDSTRVLNTNEPVNLTITGCDLYPGWRRILTSTPGDKYFTAHLDLEIEYLDSEDVEKTIYGSITQPVTLLE